MRIVLGALALLGLAACTPADLLNATIATSGLRIEHDIAYGREAREKLDIYRPDGAGAAPIVVFFYGGSWRNGSKADYVFVAATLARHGMVVVAPDYRLYPPTTYPGFLEDCAQAVAWTQAHGAEHGGDAGNLFLMGHSAGAYNVMMLALDPAYLAAAGSDRARLRGAVGLAGPYNFLPIDDPDIMPVFPDHDDPATQPIHYADGHNPPLLLLAGADDTTVQPRRNTVGLADRVRASGGPVEAKLYPGIGHVGLVTAYAPLLQGRAPVLADTLAFIRARLSGGAAIR